MPEVFRESDLEFRFSPEWIVRDYDGHGFYRRLSGHGYAGVDFLLLHRSEPRGVWLEVKNYRPRFQGLTPKPLLHYRSHPEAFAERMAEKARGTRRGLAQIDRHYRGRWWWRFANGSRWRERDSVFFPTMHALSAEQITFVACVVLAEAYADLPDVSPADFRQNLQRAMPWGEVLGYEETQTMVGLAASDAG